MDLPILSFVIFFPLLTCFIMLLTPKKWVNVIRVIGVLSAILSFVVCCYVWWIVGTSDSQQMHLVESRQWIPEFKVMYTLGVDGISAPMIAITSFLTIAVLFYTAFTIQDRVKEFYVLFMLLETGMMGVFLSLDLVLFYIFWEIGLVPMFLIIGVWGGKRREYAAIKFFLYTLSGSVFSLLAILSVFFHSGTFNILEIAETAPFAGDPLWANIAFWAFFVAFAIKIPIFPFHTWLPDAHTEAPTGGSVILAGVLLKLGAYGMMRIALPLFPDMFYYYSFEIPIITVLSLFSIVYGAMVCMAQWDLKRLVAYSSVAHMGYVALGLASAAAGVRLIGNDAKSFTAASASLVGAAMQEFSHGIITGAMFFLVGMLYERVHTRDLKAFGGLAKQIPVYYGFMLLIAFASLGLPGLIGFWSEFFVFKGTIRFMPIMAFIGILGMIFTAGYVLWKVIQSLFFGTLDQDRWQNLGDLKWWERLTLWPFAIIIVVFGFYPSPLLTTFNTAITAMLNRIIATLS
jgi:NADH-quinone oxidoreductase subunit M